MNQNFYSSSRRIPDLLMEELVAALLRAKSFEFKSLFADVHAALKERKVGGGGEEMLRLRTYDKLQSLVRDGSVTKAEGRYRGVRKQLLITAKGLQELRQPRPANHAPVASPMPAKKTDSSSRKRRQPPA
jgi:hypothetical protein